MNFLAHLYLSENTPEFRIGNLMGDFIKSSALEGYPIDMKRGVSLHHKIDAYTDAHPVFQTSRKRLSLHRRRYSGILVDIFYDHFLARHWSTYHSQPLDEFAESVYSALKTFYPILPDSLKFIAPMMIRHNWLTSYREIAGMEKALQRVSRQIRRANDIADAIDELDTHYQGLEEDFLKFMPDIIAHIGFGTNEDA